MHLLRKVPLMVLLCSIWVATPASAAWKVPAKTEKTTRPHKTFSSQKATTGFATRHARKLTEKLFRRLAKLQKKQRKKGYRQTMDQDSLLIGAGIFLAGLAMIFLGRFIPVLGWIIVLAGVLTGLFGIAVWVFGLL